MTQQIQRPQQIQRAHRISMYGVSIALAFVFSYIESLFPLNIGIPGVKFGFANIVILLTICLSSHIIDAYAIAVVRVLLVGITFGNISTMLYALTGTILATTAMLIAKKTGLFGTTGISIIGGITHNIGQLITACIILSTEGLIYYLPVLIIAGLIAGIVIGIITDRCAIHIRLSTKE